jgi:hypothetical protein
MARFAGVLWFMNSRGISRSPLRPIGDHPQAFLVALSDITSTSILGWPRKFDADGDRYRLERSFGDNSGKVLEACGRWLTFLD